MSTIFNMTGAVTAALQIWSRNEHAKSTSGTFKNLETGLVRWFPATPRRGKWQRVFSRLK